MGIISYIIFSCRFWSGQYKTELNNLKETDKLWQQTFLYWTSVQFTDVLTALVSNNGYK